eukprot:GHVP01053315.1.p1 GENE.GHVP01053315.1~~GHVP01053315.1.p1  ORF type:complete len:129 (+),score=35.24 GHVP01053315.1:286-672(+)
MRSFVATKVEEELEKKAVVLEEEFDKKMLSFIEKFEASEAAKQQQNPSMSVDTLLAVNEEKIKAEQARLQEAEALSNQERFLELAKKAEEQRKILEVTEGKSLREQGSGDTTQSQKNKIKFRLSDGLF